MPVFVAVKCDRSLPPPFVAVGRGRSPDSGGGVMKDLAAPLSRGDEAAHRDDLAAGGGGGGDNIKRSRDYRTSTRFNVTTNAAAAAARVTAPVTWISTLILSSSVCLSV